MKARRVITDLNGNHGTGGKLPAARLLLRPH